MIRQSALGFEVLNLIKMSKSRFEKFLSNRDFDYVYFLSPNPASFSVLSIPMINTVWDLGHRHHPDVDEFSFKGRFQKREFYYQNVLRRSSHVVVDCEQTKSEITSLYGVISSRVTALGLFPKEFSHSCVEDCTQSTFLFYPAQFWSHKNHSTLIRAFSGINVDYPNLKLFLAGADKGTQTATKQLVKDLDLERSVEFLGFITTDQMAMLYRHAEITVFPSRLGYTNLPPLESLLAGTPVIASDVHQFDFELPPQIYRQVPTMSSELWAQAIREVLEIGRPNKEFFTLPQLDNENLARKLFIGKILLPRN
jgi:glycosyltransferase involved in cell wall biosynthesis